MAKILYPQLSRDESLCNGGKCSYHSLSRFFCLSSRCRPFLQFWPSRRIRGSMNCRSSSAGDPGSGVADWNWTLNGVSIASNTSYCRGPSGSGTVPSNANGITVRLTMQLAGQPSCIHEYFLSQPFNPGSVPRIDLKGSCNTINYGTPVSIKANFKLG